MNRTIKTINNPAAAKGHGYHSISDFKNNPPTAATRLTITDPGIVPDPGIIPGPGIIPASNATASPSGNTDPHAGEMPVGGRISQPELHLVSPHGLQPEAMLNTAAAVHPLVDYIHLRNNALPARELLQLAAKLLRAGVPAAKLVVNDRVDVALAIGAHIQLAGHSLPAAAVRALAPDRRLGCSVHSAEEAEAAAEQGADYALFGHIFDSASKAGLPGRGLAALAETVRRCPVPVIAIGGITPDNAASVIGSGASGIAVLSGLYAAPDPVRTAEAYCEALNKEYERR